MPILTRKPKTPLFLNDVEVRDIESLRENFNVAALADYAFDGSLIKFLRERYYEDEAEKVEALTRNDPKLEDKLYKIFGVQKPEDPEIIAWRNERLAKLKTFTNDTNIFAKVDSVAFNQEDLGDLLDEGTDEIYLCNNNFRIPLKVKNKKYIGIGNAVAVIQSDEPIDFDALNISFENIKFNPEYEQIVPSENHDSTQKILAGLGGLLGAFALGMNENSSPRKKNFTENNGEITFDNYDDARKFLEKAGITLDDSTFGQIDNSTTQGKVKIIIDGKEIQNNFDNLF